MLMAKGIRPNSSGDLRSPSELVVKEASVPSSPLAKMDDR
jgi:hypothetical protein